jgi:polar amino acid transport system permease protein
LNNIATFYVEFIRGVPMLVLIFFIALVGVPTVIEWLNALGFTALSTKDVPNEVRAVIALSVTYGAFLAEIFRAGIQSITRGQMEAARSLGMSYGQAMRYVILPQAIRNVLPALGNDFVAMVKDSSLVSLLAVGDITYKTKLYSGTSFRFREGYTILALFYLLMTVILSRFMSMIERRMSNE